MKTKNQTFVIFTNFNIMTGEAVRRKDIFEVFDKMLKRQERAFSHIEFRNEDGNRIHISGSFIDDGMTIQETIDDWLEFASEDELQAEIHAINPKDWRNHLIF